MARIRTIKPDFWTDEEIVELDPLDRLLFIGLWNFCDDQGFMDYRPKKIKMQVMPADDIDIPRALERLRRASLVVAYDAPNGVVLHIRNWGKHQRVNNPSKERYSPSDLRERGGFEDTLHSPNDSWSPEGKGMEGKGREGKGRDGAGAPHLGYRVGDDEPAEAMVPNTMPETTFPKGWGPGARHIAYAAENALEIRGEFSRFRDHARDKGRLSRDWDAALMGWLRDSATRAKSGGGASYGRKPTTDDRVREHAALVQRLEANEAQTKEIAQ